MTVYKCRLHGLAPKYLAELCVPVADVADVDVIIIRNERALVIAGGTLFRGRHFALNVSTTGITCYRQRRGVVVSGVRRMHQVNQRRARLVLQWVTVFGQVYRLGV